MVAGEGRQVVDVHMDVDEAALHLYHIVVSLLCILLASCLVGVGEVDVQRHDGEVGEAGGHVLLGGNSLLCILLVIEEEEVSCLVGVGEVDVQNHEGEVGED